MSTNESDRDVTASPDVVSDPAPDDSEGGDWSAEVGATDVGPATNTYPGDDPAR